MACQVLLEGRRVCARFDVGAKEERMLRPIARIATSICRHRFEKTRAKRRWRDNGLRCGRYRRHLIAP
jgi:hypothetical protein